MMDLIMLGILAGCLWSGEAVRRFLRETGGTEGSETVKQEG